MSQSESQHLYVLRVSRREILTEGPSETEQGHIARHGEYLQRMTDEGRVLLAGRTQNNDERTFGIVLLATCTEEAAAALMAGDPAIEGGVMTGELFPFRTAFAAPSGGAGN